MTVDETVIRVLPASLRESTELTYDEKLVMAKDLRPVSPLRYRAEAAIEHHLERQIYALESRMEKAMRIVDHVKQNRATYTAAALTATAIITSYCSTK